jgi:phosphatidylglycerol:prolipoprotein diacylglycerol transferase
MINWFYFYQHIPERFNPVFFSTGPFHVSWYAIMYLAAFLTVYLLLKYRIKKKELSEMISAEKAESYLLDFLLYAFIGLLIGARLGEVFFYNFSYYVANPMMVISPFDPVTHKFIGIYGMSYHGGVIGVIVASLIFCQKFKINFWHWANFISPASPAGYFFGRIGNFINGELYGRITTAWWGMYFPQAMKTHCNAFLSQCELHLRYPSQLYEAFLEGLILFLILWLLRNKNWAKDNMLVIYLFGYAVARIICEFFREPDGWIGFLTIGQFLSFIMLFASFLVFLKTRKYVKIEGKEGK